MVLALQVYLTETLLSTSVGACEERSPGGDAGGPLWVWVWVMRFRRRLHRGTTEAPADTRAAGRGKMDQGRGRGRTSSLPSGRSVCAVVSERRCN